MGRSPNKKRRAGKGSKRHRLPASAKEVARGAKKKAAQGAAKLVRRRASSGVDTKAEIAKLSRELSEAQQRQAATAEVLQVIASSPGDLKPVFDQMLAKAMRLCEAQCGFIYQGEQGAMRAVAEIGVPRAFAEYRRHNLHTGGAATPIDAMRATKKPTQVHDARDSEPYRSGNPNAVAGVDRGGARTVLYVPMIKNDDIVGVINLYRQEVRPFTDEQIALLENFASQAVIAIENARLFNETKEALAQQTATSEVLRVISNSIADTAPVFEKILDSCEKLFATEQLGIFVVQPDGQTHVGAWRGSAVEVVIKSLPRPVEETATGAVIRNRTVLHVPNTAVAQNVPATVQYTRDQFGDISMAWAPMLTEESGIGSIAVMRQPPNPFSEKELALLKTFADQAVIAIQNTRLFNETREALARQTATADVLKVIASSPSNLQPVFDAIAERSKALIGGHSTTVFRFAGDMVELVGATSVGAEADAVLRATFPMPVSNMRNIHRVLRGEISVTIDAAVDTEPESSRNVARARGWRSRLVVPLKGDNEVIGFISITRKEPGAFADKDVELVRTFADQAVIAVQNVKLFEEVQAKTRDLEESLEQQTATADVLKVISRSAFDLQTVLDTLVESAYKLCGASLGLLYLRGEQAFECKAIAGAGVEAAIQLFKGRPIRAGRGTAAERVILTGKVHAVTDFFADPEFDPIVRDRIRNDSSGSNISQLRSTLAVPMMRENEVVGVMAIARPQTGIFPQRQTELLQTFADQAVIAIENARLFEQVQQRTRELSQSLDDLRAAQDRLVQTEKLASLGQLTAGIAHEIKNPLNFINNFSALSVELTDELNDVLSQAELAEKLQQEVDELTQLLKSNLEKVVQHGKRADSIVKNMLLHSREGSGEQRAADINALVEESLNLAYHGARAEKSGFNITLEREFDAERRRGRAVSAGDYARSA